MAPLHWHIRGARVLEEIANSEPDVRQEFDRLIEKLQRNPTKGEGIGAVKDRPDGYYSAYFDRAVVEYAVFIEPGPGIDFEHVRWFSRPKKVPEEPLPELPK